MEVDDARLLPEVDAVHAWTPRDRVVIEQMVTYLASTRQNVFVEVEELETYIYIYITFQQMLRVLPATLPGARVIVKGAEGLLQGKQRSATLVAKVKQFAMMRAMQDEEYQELH